MPIDRKQPSPFVHVCGLCRVSNCPHMENGNKIIPSGPVFIDHGVLVKRKSDGKLFSEVVAYPDGRLNWVTLDEKEDD